MQFSFLFSSNSLLSLHVFIQLAWREYFDTDIFSFIRKLWTRQIPGSVGSVHRIPRLSEAPWEVP